MPKKKKQNNCFAHKTVKKVPCWFKNNNENVLKWQRQSSEVNLIENKMEVIMQQFKTTMINIPV